MEPFKVVPTVTDSPCPHRHNVNCGDCRMKALCLPLALELDQVEQLDRIIQRGRPYQRDEHIYRAGDAFHAVYAVRSGAIKTFAMTDQGVEQVTGFYLPGEIFG
ncbi:MAG: cyclic nucleotide-binding domain-containing protein, partial [Gammaproteobacteria bacterium]|nr:cyclic nucleotide-binding domain-containing protein [Gammaproteobacteria bacterium]